MMVEKERGRLCSIQRDGSDSVPYIIKKNKLLIGRGDTCQIRIYVDGVEPEHCIISFNEEGRGFIEAVNKCGLVFLNGETIERQISLEHRDVITVVKRSFRFFYPPSSKFFVSVEPTAVSQENMGEELSEFDPEDVFMREEEENLERRVTFGPRLSPEEFDKRMPPATPLRKGSLPSDKLKLKTPCSAQDFTKSHFKKDLFKNSPLTKAVTLNEQFSPGKEMPIPSIILPKFFFDGKIPTEKKIVHQRRPLFSEIVKKSAKKKFALARQAVLKLSPERVLMKRSLKLKDSRSKFYKSPKKPVYPRLAAVTSTGHANSPETIIICKKRHNPNSRKNSLSSVQKRKSLRLSHRNSKVETTSDDPNSESSEQDSSNLLLLQNNSATDNHDDVMINVESHIKTQKNRSTPVPEKHSISTPINLNKKKISLGAKETPTSVLSEGTSSEEKNEIGTPQRRKSRSNTPAKDISVSNTPSSRKSRSNTPAKDISVSNTPSSRKSRSNTPAKDISVSNTPSSRKSGSQKPEDMVIFDEESDEEFEGEQSINENNENEVGSSSLVAAMNNVSQIDGNSIDKSMKDIHNAVETLCHSNVSALGNESSSDEMCDNAIKKLALTISMISAFRTYNRIIDDVSPFPLSFPSTSFENPADNMSCIPRNAVRHNDDFMRMSWFQDIMRNFFANSVGNDYNGGKRGMLRTHEDDLCSSPSLPVANKKSKSTNVLSKAKLQKTVTSQVKTSKRKFSCSHDDLEWLNNEDEMNESANLDNKLVCEECGLDVGPSYTRKSPRTSSSSSATNFVSKTTRSSLPSNKEVSYPVSKKSRSKSLSSSLNMEAGKSRTSKKGSDSVRKKSVEKPAVESPRTSISRNTPISASKTTRSSVSRKSIEKPSVTSSRTSLSSNTEIPAFKTSRYSVSRKSIEKPVLTSPKASLSSNTTVSALKTARSSVGRKSVEKPVVISPRKSFSKNSEIPVSKTTRSSVGRKSLENPAAASPRSLSSSTTVPVSKTPRSSFSNKEISPSLTKKSHNENSASSPNLQPGNSRTYEKGSVDPVSKKTIDKSVEPVQELSGVFPPNRLILFRSPGVSFSPLKKTARSNLKNKVSLLPPSARKMRIRKFDLPKNKLGLKSLTRIDIRVPKRLKAQKKESKHRRDVLEKVKFRVMSPNNKGSQLSMKLHRASCSINTNQPRASLKRNEKRESDHKTEPKKRKMSTENFEKPKMKLSKSPMKNKVSPKLLRKRADKRKSVLYKRKGLTKKSSLSTKIPNKRNSVIKNISLTETEDNQGKKGKRKSSKATNKSKEPKSNRRNKKGEIAGEAVSSASRKNTRKNKTDVCSTAAEIEGSPVVPEINNNIAEEPKSSRRNKKNEFAGDSVSSASRSVRSRKNKKDIPSTSAEIEGSPTVPVIKEKMTKELKSNRRIKKDQSADETVSSASKPHIWKNREVIQSTTAEIEESPTVAGKKGVRNQRKARGKKVTENNVEPAAHEKKNSSSLENVIQIKDIIDSPKPRGRPRKIQNTAVGKESNPEETNSPIKENAVKTRRKRNAVSTKEKELNDIKSPEKEGGKRRKITKKASKTSETPEKIKETAEISPKSKKEQKNVAKKDIKSPEKEGGKRRKITKKASKTSETPEKIKETAEISPKSKKEEKNVAKKDNKTPEKGGAKRRRKNAKDSEIPETPQEIKETAKTSAKPKKEQKSVTKRGKDKGEKKNVKTEVSPRITRSLRSRK